MTGTENLDSARADSPSERQAELISPDLPRPVPRTLCTDCGVSRMADPTACGQACQFIKPDYERLERRIHGRSRDAERPDELHFGVFQKMVRARLRESRTGAQWTGIATRLGERLLETGTVEAVLTVVPSATDRWKPEPALITRPHDMVKARGMRMGFAPLLALLEPARAQGIKKIAVIGIPCQVYALRALEEKLGFEKITVIGTPCSDNTTTERFHDFLALLSEAPETISYLEFRADYHVELRFTDGRQKLIPFLNLPISKLPADFFPLTCRTCVDYTNALADLTVGYMGGDGDQWLLARNQRGTALLDLLGREIAVETPSERGNRAGPVKGFITNTERAAGGLPLRSMPGWVRPLAAFLMPRLGPRGLEFARSRVEMKAGETILHLRRQMPAKMKNMIPPHVWALMKPYGLTPAPGETDDNHERAESDAPMTDNTAL